MTPDAFAAEIERIWGQVKPLYVSLHADPDRGFIDFAIETAVLPAE